MLRHDRMGWNSLCYVSRAPYCSEADKIKRPPSAWEGNFLSSFCADILLIIAYLLFLPVPWKVLSLQDPSYPSRFL